MTRPADYLLPRLEIGDPASPREVVARKRTPNRSADVSECGRYRYSLTRRWYPMGELATFVMLNPSTADADHDDPTIRRCIGFARSWDGCAGIHVVNLFAYRATDPRELALTDDPVGPRNDRAILDAAFRHAGPIVAAWGAHPAHARVEAVREILTTLNRGMLCLGTTKSGAPRHPLYLRADSQLAPWPA